MNEPSFEPLPYHWIKLKSSGTIFLDRMEVIVKTKSALKPERAKGKWLDRLFIPIGDCKHYTDLQIDISVEAKLNRLVRIDARARWKDTTLFPKFYDEVVTKTISPYLNIYNQQHKINVLLEKGKLYTGRPDLPEEATTIFKRFIALSIHKHKPSMPDWDSLYRFIHHCHGNKIKLSTSEMIHFLTEAGFVEESAKQIAKIYAHGRNVLSLYKWRPEFFQVYFD